MVQGRAKGGQRAMETGASVSQICKWGGGGGGVNLEWGPETEPSSDPRTCC